MTGQPSYSRDMWDVHGVKMISERIERSKKAMKSLRDFFQDAANMSFKNAQTQHKLQSLNIGQSEFGTLKFVEDRYCELIETMSKNEEILGSKIKTQCCQKLSDQISRISRVNTKLLADLQGWQKSLEREQKKLRKAKQSYDEKKRQTLAVIKALKTEKEHLNAIKGNQSQLNKAPQIESNIMSLQQKCKHMQAQSREQLENYIKAVSVYRGFRLKYDSSTSTLLDQLEQTECDRAQMVHRVLKLYLEIQQVMVQQSLRNIETISKHIANIDANSDNMIFVEKYRSNQRKPDLPDPKFHPDDEDDGTVKFVNTEEESIESAAQTTFWCEKWRLVVGKILERDIELVSPKTNGDDASQSSHSLKVKNTENDSGDTKDNTAATNNDKSDSNDSFAFIQLTDEEYKQLREKCLESLSTPYGRLAFALIINRQRNTEYGLELQKNQFLGLVELINLFFDAIQTSSPLDIKPAKLVMIMSQSLYVKKKSVIELLTKKELEEFEQSKLNDLPETNGSNDDENASGTLHQPQSSVSFLPKKNKLFIVDRIKNHEIWKMEKFWKEAYCDSVQQEILRYPVVKKWHSEQELQEAERREEQIIFSQLAAWTHNMKEFGTEEHKILTFLETRGLKGDQVAMLKATLQLTDTNVHSEQDAQNGDASGSGGNEDNDDQKNDEENDAVLNENVNSDNNSNHDSSMNAFETTSEPMSPTSVDGLP
eukprot:CAMPEP_0197020542 /NCGR_PEP_ID=MMETSP1384-20130603/1356_1 /TAXON_ID=29189 /ORGANISM="Ammonia sp." /LENGTH=709 /DNA_ID=CAMNT_0042448193 /DNA_START=39 /DNA_END=2168 /DNA_ORIENTATION=+